MRWCVKLQEIDNVHDINSVKPEHVITQLVLFITNGKIPKGV